MDFVFELILSLFYRKKEKQKKLAAAEKYAKIMILSLNKKNSLRSDSFLFLTLQTHNFLTLFLQGGRFDSINKDSIKNKSLLSVDSRRLYFHELRNATYFVLSQKTSSSFHCEGHNLWK